LRFYSTLTTVGLDLPESSAPAPSAAPAKAKSVPSGKGETLEQIQSELGDCTRCRLHSGRQTIVFGVGNPNADLMFVGGGPKDEEDDIEGLPFVGPVGQLLTKIIQAIDMSREEVYIANVVKCRPPGNRDPQPDEIATCLPFVERQVRSIQPRVICTLGRVAAQTLLSTTKSLGQLRGTTFPHGDAVLIPTYHPAYLLRYPGKKRETWEDLKLVRRLLHGER
jgi:DNA polymerase